MSDQQRGNDERLAAIERRLTALELALSVMGADAPKPTVETPRAVVETQTATNETQAILPVASLAPVGAASENETVNPVVDEAVASNATPDSAQVMVSPASETPVAAEASSKEFVTGAAAQAAAWTAAHADKRAVLADLRKAAEIERVTLGGGPPARRTPGPAWTLPDRLPKTPADIESIIGGRWYAVAGALVFIIGIGLLITLAVREGWFGHFPPAFKCAIGAVGGFALLGAGGALKRKGNAWGAVSLFAAGLGSVFASVYAAYAVYDLLAPTVAFVCLVSTALLGVGIGVVSDSLAVCIVALVGGYLTPILIHTQHPTPFVFPAYLITLQVIGLTLSAFKGGRFATLRTLTWWATLLLGTPWALTLDASERWFVILFVAAEWAVVHAELWVYTQRLAEGKVRPLVRVDVMPGDAGRSLIAGSIAGSFITTTWAVLLAVMALDEIAPGQRWMAPAALLMATGAVGFMLAGHLRAMLDTPSTDRERLGASMAVQAGALLIATVALGISGWAQALAWIGLGAGFAVAAAWTRVRSLIVYGAVVLVIATLRLVAFEPILGGPGLWATPYALLGLSLTHWTLLMLGAAAGWLVTAGLAWSDASRVMKSTSRFAGVAGVLVLMASMLSEQAVGTSISGAWLAVAAVVFALTRVTRYRSAGWLALLPVLGTTVELTTFDLRWFQHTGEETAGLVLTAWNLMLLACSGAWIFASTRVSVLTYARLFFGVGVIVAMLGVCNENSQAISIELAWCAMAGMLLAAGGLLKRLPGEMYAIEIAIVAVVLWGVRSLPYWTDSHAALGLHPALLVSFVMIGLFAWIARMPVRESLDAHSQRGLVRVSVVVGVLVLFTSTSAEVVRAASLLATDVTARAAWLSVWWGVFAIGLLAVGLWRKLAAARYAGLGLLGVATLKALIFDLAEVSLAWRVVSFLTLGAIMMAIAVVYGRMAKQQGKPVETADEMPVEESR